MGAGDAASAARVAARTAAKVVLDEALVRYERAVATHGIEADELWRAVEELRAASRAYQLLFDAEPGGE